MFVSSVGKKLSAGVFSLVLEQEHYQSAVIILIFFCYCVFDAASYVSRKMKKQTPLLHQSVETYLK